MFRFLKWMDSMMYRALLLWGIVRDELAWAITSENDREKITHEVYSSHSMFKPGEEAFRAGLFDWERLVIQNENFPRNGRILIGGCGGGREVQVFAKLGYSVVGLEPAPELAKAAQQFFESDPKVSILKASYEDLVRAVEAKSGELWNELKREPIDAVILGWGSFPHVASALLREKILRSMKSLAPRSPLLVSFWTLPPKDFIRFERFRHMFRMILQKCGAKQTASKGDLFSFNSGFTHLFSQAEVETLANHAGYKIIEAHYYSQPQPYALLIPQ